MTVNNEDQTQSAVEKSTVSSTSETAKPTKKRKIFRRTLAAVSVFTALTLGGVTAIIGTESGTKWALQLVDRTMDSLSIGEVSGKLQNGLTLKDIKFATNGVDVHVANVRLHFDFSCLLHREICIEDITIQQTNVAVDTTLLSPSEETPKESSPMTRIDLPISVTVKKINIEETNVQIDHHQMALAQFQSAVSLNNDSGLTLSPTLIDTFNVESVLTDAQFEQQQKAAEQQAIEAEKNAQPIDWAAIEQTLTPAILGNITEITLPFDMHVEDLQIKNIGYKSIVGNQVHQEITVPDAQLQAHVKDYQLELSKFSLNSSLGSINGNGSMQLNGEMPLAFNVKTEIAPVNSQDELLWPKTDAELELSGSLKNVTALSLKTNGDINAELNGQIELNKEKLPLQLNLTSKSAQYAFIKGDPLKLNDLDLQITGNLLDYQVKLKGQADGFWVPTNSYVDLVGSGKLYQADIEKLNIKALNGSAELSGKVNWKDGAAWESQVKFENLNVSQYGKYVDSLKNFPAILSGSAFTSGFAGSKGWSSNTSDLDIKGTISQRPLVLKGSVLTSQETPLKVSNLLLTYGENKLTANGTLDKNSDFKLDVNAPNLKGLLPNLTASLNGKAMLSGNISEPNLDLDLTGNSIQFQDLHLNKMTAKGKVTSSGQVQGDLNLALNGFSYGENLKLQSATLTASGNEKNHKLQLRSQGEPVAANLDLTGNFDRTSQMWKGVISQTTIKSSFGEFKNNQINVSYDNKAINANISAHCWTNPEIELCFPQAFNAGKNGEIPFDLKKFDLNFVNKLANNDVFKGQLTSQGKFAWYADKPIKLDMKVNGNNINIAQKLDYRTFKLAVSNLSLNAQIADNNLTAKTDISLQNQGNINADIKLTDLAQTRKLGGALKIAGLNLNILNQLLTNGEKVSGDINANLGFAGNLNAPLLNGSFDIRNTKAIVGAMPFNINDGEIALRFNGASSTLQGHIITPESRLDLDGDARWRNINDWHSRVHAQAHEFYLNIPSIAKIKVSPDVEMKATPTLLDLTGNIDIPWGRIAIESLPESAVSVSSDEVILDAKTERRTLRLPTETKEGLVVRSDLRINIGDDVNINAYGLNSQLQGRLMVKQEKGKLGLYGGIDLKNGRYASFGQDLLIRKGQVSFSGIPSQPLLNIEAIRNPEAMEDSKVTAGVKVIGLADAPEVTVFSEPSMPQDQALSYILTGRSLENSGEAGSGGSIGAALLGMGLAKSGKAVGKIGEAFGISDLNLGTAGVGESSKVVVSGNITKNLQIKYGVGLFDGLAEITLRYRLLPQLFLQSISSTNQTFDVIYQFEF